MAKKAAPKHELLARQLEELDGRGPGLSAAPGGLLSAVAALAAALRAQDWLGAFGAAVDLLNLLRDDAGPELSAAGTWRRRLLDLLGKVLPLVLARL